MEVRQLEQENWVEVYDLIRPFYEEGHWSEHGKFSPENTARYVTEALNQACVVGAYIDGELAGVLTCEVCHEFDTRPRAYITDLFTAKEARGKGVGRKLLEFIIDFCKERDCVNIYAANTGTFSRRANALHDNMFKKYGFEEVSVNLRKVL